MAKIDQQHLIELFCTLAKIKSPSGQEEKISKKVIKLLTEYGLKVFQDSYGNIIAKLNGSGQPIIFCAHMDTVSVNPDSQIIPIINDKIITSDGKTILGADNKDAIAAILEMLKTLKDYSLPHKPLEIIFTKEEESISKGARNLDFSKIKGKICIVADHAEPYGTIVLGAPEVISFNIKINGKRAHVKNPEQGKNALLVAARAITKIPLGRIDRFTTSNLAFQTSGLKGLIDKDNKTIVSLATENRNSVPDLTAIFGEIRGIHKETVKNNLKKIKFIFEQEAKKLEAELKFETNQSTVGYLFDKKNSLISMLVEEFKKQGIAAKFDYAVGGSDANVLNQHGITSVVISSAGKNNHQLSEYLIIEELIQMANLFLNLAQK